MRVVVLGFGLDALIAAWVLRQHPFIEMLIVGEGRIGGGSALPGTSMLSISHTASMKNLLRALDVPYSTFTPRDGILLRGEIQRYPHRLREMSEDHAARVRHDHFVKERRLPPQKQFPIPVEANHRTDQRLRCIFEELVETLVDSIGDERIQSMPGWQVDQCEIVSGRRRIGFDKLIVTVPLWEAAERVGIKTSTPLAACRNVVIVEPSRQDGVRYVRWDTVITPYTPENCVHRVTSHGGECVVESSGKLEPAALLGDLNFLFPHGYTIGDVQTGLTGEPATPAQPQWPDHITPLGTFAVWDSNATLDATLDGAYELLRQWGEQHGRTLSHHHPKDQVQVPKLPKADRSH